MKGNNSNTLMIRLQALAELLPLFEAPDGTFGHRVTTEGHFPYFVKGDVASRFVQVAYEYGWCNSNIKWVDWIQTDDAQRFSGGPEPIAEASISELEHLVTTFVRQDRFVEGNLAGLFESGHLAAIVRRAAALLAEMNS